MTSGLNVEDPTVVTAFRAALAHQGLIALLIFAALSLTWVAVRKPSPEREGGRLAVIGGDELAAHRVLRIGFGLLWLLDGVLQAQPGMAAGLPSQVIQPAADSSPGWVQHLVNWAGTTWSYHPVQAGAAAVWIQAGIGLWLLAAPRGALSRLAGVASLGWGLVVWVFGEAFGGIFAPGLTWLFGAPGAALLYAVAGALLALPERYWRSPRFGRVMLGGLGVFLTGMAVLQAWPGRGFWQGTSGTLTGMIQTMTQTPQPGFIAGMVSGFGTFTASDGFAVNLVAVIVLAGLGVAFLTGRRSAIQSATWTFVVFCLADWLLIEDLGFFGGLGTDPNSMIPMALLGVAGYLAFTQVPRAAQAAAPADDATAPAARGWRDLARPAALRRSVTAATAGTMISLCAVAMTGLGVVPMAAAQANPAASAILAEAVDGAASPMDSPAPAFTLTEQHGKQVSLAGLRGKVILLTFLDPVCVTECPLIAQEFRQAGQQLGEQARQVELVAININPLYNQLSYIQAFDQQERLAHVPDWLYLTGSPAQLKKIYAGYGVASQPLPGGAMLGHSDVAYVIDQHGYLRQALDLDPGPGTAATQSSFATELATAATATLKTSP
jgi:cytochrome oxidase Cu insertion factor (SCO1/SenC/PrrC family)